jgi:hypothetical protein
MLSLYFQISHTIWANDCHIGNLVIINWLVGAGKPAISLAHLDIDKPAPTKCDLIAIAFDFALHTLTGLADFEEIGKLLLEKKLIVAGGQN